MFPMYRQGTSGATAAVGTSLAFPLNVGAGSYLFYVTIGATVGDVLNSISDTRGNTWTKIVGTNIGASRHEVWWAPNPNAGGNTVTPAYSAHTTSKRHYIFEATGLGTTPTTQTGATDNTGAADPVLGHPLTITGFGLCICTLFTDTGNATFTWSPINNIDFQGNTNMRMALFMIDSADGTSFAPTCDLTSGTETSEAQSVAIYMDPQPTGGGGESFSAAFG